MHTCIYAFYIIYTRTYIRFFAHYNNKHMITLGVHTCALPVVINSFMHEHIA